MSTVITIPANNPINTDNEIQLASGFKENAVPHTQLIELSQVSLLKSYNAHFTIFDTHFVSVYFKTFFSKPRKYWLDLAYLEATPRRVFKIDRPAFYATGVLSLTAVVLILINTFFNERWALLAVIIPMTCGALIAFLLLIYRSKDRIVFYSRYGRIKWLEFLINKPNRRAYKEFVEKLIKASHAVSNHQSARHEHRLGAELREHRRLKDEGILSSKVYEDIKLRFLGQHGYLKDVYVEEGDAQNNHAELNSSNLKFVAKEILTILTVKLVKLWENFTNLRRMRTSDR